MSLIRGVLFFDPALVQRVVQGRGLARVLGTATAVLVVGCGLYGAAMGGWRSPWQAVNAAVKLPALFLATAGLTAALDVVLCGLLRARVRPMQALTASVLAMAILGSVLGSMAPIAALLSLQAPAPSGPDAVATSQWLLTTHVLVLGAVGIVAVSRLRALLDALIDDAAVSRRVLWAWIITHGVVGAQMSWVLRPFVGDPRLPVRLFRPQAWLGSFFQSVYEMTVARMGVAGPLVLVMIFVTVVAVVAAHLDPPVERFELVGSEVHVFRRGAAAPFRVSVAAIRDVAVVPSGVRLSWTRPGNLSHSVLLLPCASPDEAREVQQALAWATRPQLGYRSPVLHPVQAGTKQAPTDS